MKLEINDGGRAAAGYQGKAGDCGTRAIAIATGLPYQEVYDALSLGMRTRKLIRHRKASARNGTAKVVLKKYLASLGWLFTPTMGIGTGCRFHLRDGDLPMGRLIVQCSSHLVAVIDGVIHDTYDPSRGGTRCVYGYWTKENA